MDKLKDKLLGILKNGNIQTSIQYIGTVKKQNQFLNSYLVTITSPKGTEQFQYWDSIHNTMISNMSLTDYAERTLHRSIYELSEKEVELLEIKWKMEKKRCMPDEYCVITCLQKYDVGTKEDFYKNFSKEVHSLYSKLKKEYRKVCRVFTQSQLKKIRELL